MDSSKSKVKVSGSDAMCSSVNMSFEVGISVTLLREIYCEACVASVGDYVGGVVSPACESVVYGCECAYGTSSGGFAESGESAVSSSVGLFV